MSHDRSTPSSPGSQDFATSPPSSRSYEQVTTGRSSGLKELTDLERWTLERSESTFNSVSGALAGLASGVVTCPLDVIKTKLQAQGGFRAVNPGRPPVNAVYTGMLGTARVIWKEEGVRGMYRGLGPTVLGYLPTWAVWFTVYGRSKLYFQQYHDNPDLVNFGSSIVAGASSTMVTNPIWVIKTRLMSQVSSKASQNEARPPWQYRSTIDAARKMYRTEGILSFYSGLTPALLGLTHVAVQFPVYEFLKRKFTGHGMGKAAEGDPKSQVLGITAATFFSKLLATSATYPHEVIRTRLQTQQRSVPSSTSEYVAFRSGLEGSQHRGAADIPVKGPSMKYRGIVTTFQTILREEGWRAFYAGMGTNMMRAVPAATTTMLTYEYMMGKFRNAQAEARRKTESI